MPRFKPLEEWICDTCRQPVSIADGWVEWLDSVERGTRDFHIVHNRNGCFQHTDADDRSDMHLNYFLGPDGLQYLLAMLDVGRILDPSAERLPAITDLPSFVEVFRRLHIPYYEEARLYFGDALQDGHFARHNEVAIFLPETCKAIIERYEKT